MLELLERVIMFVASLVQRTRLPRKARTVATLAAIAPLLVCWMLAAALFLVFIVTGCLAVLFIAGPSKASAMFSEMMFIEHA